MNEIETWSDWRRRYLRTAKQSPHEWEFLRLVLQEVPGLKPSQLTPQREFVGNDGRTLHMDFAIETPYVKIAIELEGWDKTGNGQGKSKAEHDHFNRRLQSLSAQGWEVLPITNAQFHADPVHYILDIGRRIDPRKFELPPIAVSTPAVSPVTASPSPVPHPPSAPVTENTQISSNKGAIWAILAVGLLIALVVGIFLSQASESSTSPEGTPPADMDCGDFTSRAEAQAWYDKYVGKFGDYANLDSFGNSQGDGQACTSYKY